LEQRKRNIRGGRENVGRERERREADEGEGERREVVKDPERGKGRGEKLWSR
jgi:hypothetical protein